MPTLPDSMALARPRWFDSENPLLLRQMMDHPTMRNAIALVLQDAQPQLGGNRHPDGAEAELHALSGMNAAFSELLLLAQPPKHSEIPLGGDTWGHADGGDHPGAMEPT